MKWIMILLVAAAVGIGLRKYGFLNEFLEPWKGWANYIGYFQ